MEREVTQYIEEMAKLQKHRRAGTMTQAYWDSLQDKQDLNTYSILQRIIQGAANDRVLEFQEDRKLSNSLPLVITLIEERLHPIRSQLCDISRKLEEKTETSSVQELQEDKKLSTKLSSVIMLIEERLNPIWCQLDDISRKLEAKTEMSSANEDCRSWVNMECENENKDVDEVIDADSNGVGDLEIDLKTLTRSELEERCEHLQTHRKNMRKALREIQNLFLSQTEEEEFDLRYLS